MNGLAAWFNGSGQLLQNAAWLGALIILAIGLFGATLGKATVSGGTLGTWFFFMSMMGITGQAQVINIYTNVPTVIANVPALALVPASVFSKAAYNVFKSMDAAFQSANGSYMSISQFGFVGPLDILLSLRSPRLAVAEPALVKTLVQVVHDCAIDPNATGYVPPLANDYDMLNWLTMYGRGDGLSRIYTDSDASGKGTIVACKNGGTTPYDNIEGVPYDGALDYINKKFGVMAQGSLQMVKFINAETTKTNPQDPKGMWNAGSLADSHKMLIDSAIGVNQSAEQFTKNALVASTITYTMDCLSQSGAMSTPDTCVSGAMALGDSMEKWKTTAAMAGSGFLKTMFTSMSLLQALFFALFPIIAIYGLVVPMNTGKVFGGFIFFGIWCQSWLLTVAPVQSYIQNSIIDEMSKIIGTSHAMTLANSMQVYQALSTKLAIAGDIMASCQMLSLALLSGSMVALSSLAGKWSGEKHMDNSKLQHDVSKSASLVDHKSSNSVSSIVGDDGKMTSINNRTGAGDYSLQTSAVKNTTKGHASGVGNSYDDTRAKENNFQQQLSTKFGLNKEQAATLTKSLAAVNQVQGSIGANIATALVGSAGKMLKELKGAPLTPADTEKLNTAAAEAQKTAITELAASDPGYFADFLGKNGPAAQADSADRTMDRASMVLSGLVIGAETLGGVGVGGAVLGAGSYLAINAGNDAAKAAIRNKIMTGPAPNQANIAAAESLASKPGGVARFASGVIGDIKASVVASVQDTDKSDTTDKSSKSRSKDKTFTATDADKITKSWKDTHSEIDTDTNSKGETTTAAFTLTPSSVAAIGVNGVDGQTGKEVRDNAKMRNDVLKLNTDPEKYKAAWNQAIIATNMRGPEEYGGGAHGQQMSDFEKQIYTEAVLTGKVDFSKNPSGANPFVSSSSAVQPTPPSTTPQSSTNPPLSAVPKAATGKSKSISSDQKPSDATHAKPMPPRPADPVGSQVGTFKMSGSNAGKFNSRAEAATDDAYNKAPSAAAALKKNAPAAALSHDGAVSETKANIGKIAVAAVVLNAAEGAAAFLNERRLNQQGGSSQTTPEQPGDKKQSAKSGGTPAETTEPPKEPKKREPINQRTRGSGKRR